MEMGWRWRRDGEDGEDGVRVRFWSRFITRWGFGGGVALGAVSVLIGGIEMGRLTIIWMEPSLSSLCLFISSFVSLLLLVILFSQFQIVLGSPAALPISKDLGSSPRIICKIHVIFVLGANILNE